MNQRSKNEWPKMFLYLFVAFYLIDFAVMLTLVVFNDINKHSSSRRKKLHICI